jgi:hypothetical protein
MKADLEMVLIHDGKQWVARQAEISAWGETLPELDDHLVTVLRQSGQFPPATQIKVLMNFDFETIPTWLRQYAYHYFNRYVYLEL